MDQKIQKDLDIDVGAFPLSTINFLLETLNRNPLGAPVMQVASLISTLQERARSAVDAAAAAEEAAAAEASEKAA